MAVVTKQELEDASVDAQTLEDVTNGAADLNGNGTVTSRLGQVIKTVAKSIQDLNTVGVVTSAISALEVELGAPASSLVIKADGTAQAPNGVSGEFVVKGTSASISSTALGGTIGATGSTGVLNLVGLASTGAALLDFRPNDGATGFLGRISHSFADNSMGFYTNATERARIDASGNLLVGKTIAGNTSILGTELSASGYVMATRAAATVLYLNRTADDGTLVEFYQDNTAEGSISITGATTSYNTTSDYRKKENVVPMTGATERLLQLKPSTFNFISHPDKTVDGFLAHEAQAVVPEAVQGVKDEMQTVEITPAVLDEEGNEVTPAVTEEQPKYQQIDQSKIIPLAVKALQEALERIDTLEERVAILEG